MNDAQRWGQVLEAHAREHDAMRGRNAPHVTVQGRPHPGVGALIQMPEMFSPYGMHQVNMSPYKGLGALTDSQKTNAIGAAVVVAVALGALWYARG